MSKIQGVTHPIPTNIAERIYSGKNIVVIKTALKKIKKGQKFIVYESKGAQAYTGWADIIRVENIKVSDLWYKHSENITLNHKEYIEYVGKKPIISFYQIENFKLFNKKFIPKNFVSMRGKYIYDSEFEEIDNWVKQYGFQDKK